MASFELYHLETPGQLRGAAGRLSPSLGIFEDISFEIVVVAAPVGVVAFAWNLSHGTVRWGSCTRRLSTEIFRLGSIGICLAWKRLAGCASWRGGFCLESFAWTLPLGIFLLGIVRLGSFAWNLWGSVLLGNVQPAAPAGVGGFAWSLSLGIFRLEPSLGTFRLESFASDLSCRLRWPGWGLK